MSGDCVRLSTASTMPSWVWIAIAVRPELDRLDGVLHLKQTTLGGERGHPAVVLAACHEHGARSCSPDPTKVDDSLKVKPKK